MINKAERIITDLFAEFESHGAILKRMNAADQEIVNNISNQKNYIVWINDYSKLIPHFINDAGTKFYGYSSNHLRKQGFALYEDLIHPDHFNDIHKTVALLTQNPKDIFEMTYRVKKKNGEWKWTYSITKTMNYDENGNAILVMAVVFDVAELVHLYHFKDANAMPNKASIESNRALFNSLTKRELEILHLIAEENTSIDISAQLNIEVSTVNTHRKRIIKKLGVKSSVGLVKFDMLFNTYKT